MRVIFMGTPDFAAGILEAVLAAGHEVSLVVTQPDKPKGRGRSIQESPVKACAKKHGLMVYQPKRIREDGHASYLKSFLPDLIVTAAFGQILTKEVLEIPTYGCINIHASLLPKYRGAAPIQWAVINGDAVSGVTAMRMDEGIDTGDIIETAEVVLAADETGGSLFGRLADEGAKLCVHTMRLIEEGKAVYTKQEESEATYAGMISKQLGDIDWTKSAVEIERLIRGLNPWPSAYTKLNGRTLKIWRAKAEAGGDVKSAGTVVSAGKKELKVQTGDGCLLLLEVQSEGRKRMDIEAFLRGCSIEAGTILKNQEG